MVLKGQATPTGPDQKVKVAKGQYVQLAFEGEDQILTLLGQFGDDPATHDQRPADTHRGHQPRRRAWSAAQPDSTAQPAWRSTTPRSGRPTSARRTTRPSLYDKGANPSMANWYLEQSSGRYSVDGYVSDWVQVPFNESRTAATTAAASSARATSAGSSRTRSTPGGTSSLPSRTAAAPSQPTPGSPSSTSGIATTSTVTATSTSRTATSTTSSRCTPAKARRPAAAPRAPTPSGATARTSTASPSASAARPGGVPNLRWRAASATATTGSATTPSSPRTVASVCSRTSSAMTSACPTSTTPAATPVAPRTAPPGGRSCRRARTGPSTASTSGRRRCVERLGQVVHSAGSTTTSHSRAKSSEYKLGPGRDQHREAPGAHRRPARQEGHDRDRPADRRQHFYFSGSGNDLDNTMTRPITLGAGPINLLVHRPLADRDRAGTTRTCRSRPTAARRSPTSIRRPRPTLNDNGQNFGIGITGTRDAARVRRRPSATPACRT